MPLKKLKPTPVNTLDLRFEAIGTVWHIACSDTVMHPTELESLLLERIEQFDSDYSRFRSDSRLLHIGQTVGLQQLPADAQPLFDVYNELYDLTAGAMTPLIGDTLAAAGYDAHYSFKAGKVLAPPTWDQALVYDFPKLQIKQPVILDVGAAGKGYLVDIVSDVLREYGARNYIVDAGGDMLQRTSGGAAETIGLEHPMQTDEVIGTVDLLNQSICGSAGNRRSWGDYNHIIDPHTLQSPTAIAGLWVIADTTLLADALSTALYFVEPAVLQATYDFAYAIVYSDFSLSHSLNFPAVFFT